jgi:hypothetical protein
MTTPGIDGIRYGDRITRRASSSARPEGQTDWSGVNKLIGDHVGDLAKVIGDHLAELQTDVEQRVDRRLKALELQLAETRGAIDVLRGRGAPGTFRVRGTYSTGASYQALDVVVRDSSSFVALKDAPGACPAMAGR